ncbi:hypothetical protein C0991_008923 [Blastosporella zonata]|nr:hypothetical protein C0991_008923 [Blastosporella zonata]
MTRPAVFIYTPCCIEGEIQSPPSPTSSVKGLFDRSRPISFADSDCGTISSFISGNSDHSSNVSIPRTSDDDIYTLFNPRPTLPEHKHTAQIPSNGTSSNEQSIYASSTGNLPIVRRSDAIMHEVEVQFAREAVSACSETFQSPPQTQPCPVKSKKHWGDLRLTVSHIFGRHSKQEPSSAHDPLPSCTALHSPQIPSSHAPKSSKSASLESSSASLLSTGRSTKRLTISPPARIFDDPQAYARKQRLRRSRSFSGLLNAFAAIAGVGDNDGGLDEVTIEAHDMSCEIRRS